jgi:ribosomal protein L10
MSRVLKEQVVREYEALFGGKQDCFLVDFTGLPAEGARELRNRLRKEGAELKVVDVALARVAFRKVGWDRLDPYLTGPTAVGFRGDVVGMARVLARWASEQKTIRIKGGQLGLEPVGPQQVGALAGLPDRKTMQSLVLATVIAPLVQVAGLLEQTLVQTANLVDRHIEKLGQKSS